MSPPRLLVADDDAALREVICEGLEEEGFVVVAAADGKQALDLFLRDGPFDALLLDEEMPGLSGRKVLAAVRLDHPTLPALLVSGNLELDPAEQAALRVGPVLRKPVSLHVLVEEVRRAIATRRS